WGLARSALHKPLAMTAAVAVAVLFVLGLNPIVLLLGCGLLVLAIRSASIRAGLSGLAAFTPPAVGSGLGAVGAATGGHSLPVLFLTFLKIGCVVFGSGYVLLAFVQDDLAGHL